MSDALDDLVACPHCDALWHVATPRDGERVTCARCHTVLIAPQTGSEVRIIALALAVVILMLGGIFFPFLELNASGLRARSSVFGAALAFSEGQYAPLAVACAAMIILIPILRALLVIYTLVPLAAKRRAFRGARAAFRLSEKLRPWSMAEIFIVGTAVALVKLGDLADVHLGPAFWMFVGLVIVNVFQDTLMCRFTIWHAIEESERGAEPAGAREATS